MEYTLRRPVFEHTRLLCQCVGMCVGSDCAATKGWSCEESFHARSNIERGGIVANVLAVGAVQLT